MVAAADAVREVTAPRWMPDGFEWLCAGDGYGIVQGPEIERDVIADVVQLMDARGQDGNQPVAGRKMGRQNARDLPHAVLSAEMVKIHLAWVWNLRNSQITSGTIGQISSYNL